MYNRKNDIVQDLALRKGAEEVFISSRKHKKYAVLYKGKIIHFGDKRYEDFLDHNDPKRRDSYRKRASKIKNKKGELTFNDKFSPNYWSYHILW